MTDFEKIKLMNIGEITNDVNLFQKHYPYSNILWDKVEIVDKTEDSISFIYIKNESYSVPSKPLSSHTKILYFTKNSYLSMIKP